MNEVNISSAPDSNVFLLRIVASSQTERTGECIAVDGTAVIGRDPDCGVALADPSVSRRHARVHVTPDGLKVTDLGSGNGVWIGSKRAIEAVLQVGDRFRIGSTVFECVERPGARRGTEQLLQQPAVALSPGDVLVRVVEGSDRDPIGKQFLVQGGVATIGRAADCSIVLSSRDISRAHARLEVEAGGVRITDLGSSGGVWIEGRETPSALLKNGDRFRLGNRLVLECTIGARVSQPDARPATSPEAPDLGDDADRTRFVPFPVLAAAGLDADPAAADVEHEAARIATSVAATSGTGVALRPAVRPTLALRRLLPTGTVSPTREAGPTDRDFNQTVVIPVPSRQAGGSGAVESEGELLQIGAHEPFLLDDPTSAWLVVEGGILIFATAVEKDEPVGARTHFLGILQGQVCFGFDRARYGLGSGFLAVPKQATKVRKIPRARLHELCKDPSQGASVRALIDAWVDGLSRAVVATLPVKRSGELPLRPGERVDLGARAKATAEADILWIEIWSGSVVFDDITIPKFTERRALFPLSRYSWVQAASDEFGTLSLLPLSTIDALADPFVWSGLDVFHEVICECQFINKELAKVDEYIRLQQKADRSDAAAKAAYDAIGSVMRAEAATPYEFLATTPVEPVVGAWKLVGKALSVEIVEPVSLNAELTFDERIAAIASASGLRTRIVALRDDWWRQDHGPLIGQRADTKDPVALIPKSARAYECVDPKTATHAQIDDDVAATLSGFAYAPYRSLPEGGLKVADVVKFGAIGIRKDLYWVVGMAVILGLFGTATPYIIGQVFDLAIPQADRGALIGFGIALLLAAMASSLFNLTQGIAALRIQARMAPSIQSSVWDRLLNLPVNFFRNYSAGDLADRAQGVEAIQALVSGAAVAAILGSVSAIFYLAQMFGYDLRLALLAILLTGLFIGVNMGTSYLQLRYQRAEFQIHGRIAGLVFNLLTGVTKLRVCGAEQHAFRVWAEQFAGQRKINFAVGSIHNVAAVFGSIYPIISSIAIFYVVVGEQQRIALTRDVPLTTGDFIAFTAAFGLFLAAMQALADASLSLFQIVPLYERLAPILNTPAEADRSKAAPGKLRGDIELSHISFRYDPGGPWIIKDLSLRIKRGEFIALVGSSGAGKSTVMRLMLGFERPTSGSIHFDGQDLSLIDLRLLRQQIGAVLQTSQVMPTDIYRNIVGASSRTIEDAWEAADQAGLAEDIRQMPMGMYTYVSEGGSTFSGGQRQRLMIARAIVDKPKIIFLDEATSALDNRTQATVIESLDNMDATRIVVAHRLSTVIHADRICYLDNGTIAEMGTYQELMDRNGLFARLARRQMT